MKDERLYIDNELVDIDTNTKITMSVKSNLFRDVSAIVSNSTYTVKLPKTVRNQRLLRHADLVQSNDGYAYMEHSVKYFRNGVEVIKDGRATVLKVEDESIEVSIFWGLFQKFSELLSAGTTLNQLKGKDKILFNSYNKPDSYEGAKNKGYFYAGYDVWLKDDAVNYNWGSSERMILPTKDEDFGRSNYGRFGSIEKETQDGIYYLHPVVRVSWVLDLIKKNKGVDFRFTGSAKEYIDTLVLPLISKKSNELTFGKTFEATLVAVGMKGVVPVVVSKESNVFSGNTGDFLNVLNVKSDATLIVDIKGLWEFNLDGLRPSGSTAGHFGGKDTPDTEYRYDEYVLKYGYWLKMSVTTGTNTEEFIIGSDRERRRFLVPEGYNGLCRFEFSGYGKIEVSKGSTIVFEWLSDGNLKDALFLGGSLDITLQSNENVPSGGYFPIVSNLPNIKIIDFVKFLAAISGTFPLQMSQDGVVNFVPLSTVWKNRANAKDWTRRLIPQRAENKPKEIDFVFNDYAQHNFYKWKEDDTVMGNYNGDLRVGNNTLQKEKVVFEFPFAATDGNTVPMYKEEKQGEKEIDKKNNGRLSGGRLIGNGNGNENKEPSYSACKDRVLRLFDDNGKAVAKFDINMQEIIDTKYRNIYDSLQKAKVITEKMRVSDLELVNFDETKPIYLAQYGSYFAVTEIKADDAGLADVTMLQLFYD